METLSFLDKYLKVGKEFLIQYGGKLVVFTLILMEVYR